MTDVTDATFETQVLARSEQVPVVVDLWAPWCSPCRVLGPILERAVGASGGEVELAKINVDENPQVSAAFQVQSIPAVFAVRSRKVVDSFLGARPEAEVRAFVEGLSPKRSAADELVAKGDEESLRKALELVADHPGAIVALAELLGKQGDNEEALALLAKIPESAETRRVAALIRLGDQAMDGHSVESRLEGLLERVKADDAARREYLDLLEALGAEDPRVPAFRRKLASKLF